MAVNSSKKSPEVIQLLDMHTHFSSATPGTRVRVNEYPNIYNGNELCVIILVNLLEHKLSKLFN